MWAAAVCLLNAIELRTERVHDVGHCRWENEHRHRFVCRLSQNNAPRATTKQRVRSIFHQTALCYISKLLNATLRRQFLSARLLESKLHFPERMEFTLEIDEIYTIAAMLIDFKWKMWFSNFPGVCGRIIGAASIRLSANVIIIDVYGFRDFRNSLAANFN